MLLLRIIAIALPQTLVLMLIGGWFDLLGGWNHTDSGFGILILLFLLNPVVVVIYLIIETMRYRKSACKSNTGLCYEMVSERIHTSGQAPKTLVAGLKTRGYALVTNLVPPTAMGAIPEESSLVTQCGISYVNIPVA